MINLTRRILALILPLAAMSAMSAVAQDAAAEFADAAAAAADQPRPEGAIGVKGVAPGWLFLQRELQHVGHGRFWEKPWADVAASGKDPRPVIVAYHEALAKSGVKLILVPVPPKAVIYPDKLTDTVKMDGAVPAEDAVFAIADFYQPLREAGVEVIDIEPVLKAERRANPSQKLYCEQDSHPSPHTCELIARAIRDRIGDAPWIDDAAAAAGVTFTVTDPETVKVTGDLAVGYDPPKESLVVRHAGDAGGAKVPSNDKSSPVIVVGDSHLLIFSEGGEMLLTGAGVTDHLQALLGFPVYRQANKGSGVDAARGMLARTAIQSKGFYENKKILVWCFGARMFTLERNWREIPTGDK